MFSFEVLKLSILCAALFTLCDASAASWVKDGGLPNLIATLIFGPIAYLFFGYVNLHTDLAVAGGLVNALVITFTALVGIFLFKQPIQLYQIIGLAFIVAGVLMLARNPQGSA